MVRPPAIIASFATTWAKWLCCYHPLRLRRRQPLRSRILAGGCRLADNPMWKVGGGTPPFFRMTTHT